MADRSFIIDIILRARDETARAIASAIGQMDAYEAKVDEQRVKTDALTEVNNKLVKSHKDLESSQTNVARGYGRIRQAQDDYRAATNNLARIEKQYTQGSVDNATKRKEAQRAESIAWYALRDTITDVAAKDSHYASKFQIAHLDRYKTLQLENSRLQEQARIIDQLSREYDGLVNSVAQAERKLETATIPASQRGQRDVIRKSLELDVTRARIRLDEFKASERASPLRIGVDVPDHDIILARAKIDAGLAGAGGGRGGGGGPRIPVSDGGEAGSGFGGFVAAISDAQQRMASLDTSTSGFDQHIRNAFGFAIVALIQPFIALLVGLVGVFGSLASAAVAAGAAIGTTFLSAMAQGIPVMGLFAAAMARLQTIMGYVTAQIQQQQSAFIARYQFQQQVAMGINPIVIAEHSYSDALFSQQEAINNVRVAQLGLLEARQQATRQLEQLVLQEISARLAAEASSLAITSAQKALQNAIATGGDVQQAQLQLAQAHASHTQAVVSAQQAIADAAPGSIARQQIQETVVQARIGVTQAQRAVVDSQFQIAQARAAIIQARQAAVGYNLGVAAQLAYLRSQMTSTEKSLADNILRIYELFHGVHGALRPVTDAILGAFVPLTQQIYRLFTDPRIFAALLNLAHRMHDALTTVFNTIFSPQSLRNFVTIVNAAAANLRPLATIVSNLFRGIQAIVVAAIPYVHQFAGFIGGLTKQFADWANSTRGRNWLKQFFDVAFRSLEAFINLGVSVIRLFAAIIGPGGGAQSGINIIKELTKWINGATDSINHHGRVWRELKALWGTVQPTIHAIGTILGAVIHALLQLGTSPQGKKALQDIALIIAHVLVPAFVQFATIMGHAAIIIENFLARHPGLEKMLASVIAIMAAVSIGGKAIGLLFGPLSTVFKILSGIIQIAVEVGPELIAAFASPIGIVAAIVAAIVGLAAWTGKLQNLWNAVKAPFIAIWNAIKQPIDGLIKSFEYMVGSLGHLGGAFQLLRDIVGRILDGLFRAIQHFGSIVGAVLGRIIGDAIKIISGVFRVIGDIIRGNWGKVFGDFLKIGKAILDGLGTAIGGIGKLIVGFFASMVDAVLRWLGISSPSSRFFDIGVHMVKGLLNGLESLGSSLIHFGEKIVHWIIHGITSVASDLVNTIGDLLPWNWGSSGTPGPANTRNLTPGRGIGKQEGGPIPGFGGGDRHLYALEGGEHIFTKDEVRAAGGHGAIFAIRRLLGGGTQGGPFGYQSGGAVSGQPLTMLGLQNPRGQTTQGVTGILGSILANLRDFIFQAQKDWSGFWNQMAKLTSDGLGQVASIWSSDDNSLKKQIHNFWDDTNSFIKSALGDFYSNFKNTYSKFDTASFNAFWYVMHSASQALKAFDAKPIDVQLGPIPRFAGGGFVGKMGERGHDLVGALLGRGEAVLNYAHQKLVDPALRMAYGFGLPQLFQKVRGEHAGGSGYATGGYVYPFAPGTQVGRVDQGVDADPPAGSPIGPMGLARVVNIIQNWYKGQPYIWWRLLNGPLAGAFAYVSEGIGRLARPGAIIQPNQAVAISEPHGTGIEYGLATASGQTLAQATTGYSEGQATPAGQRMRSLLAGLSHGRLVAGALAGMAGVGPAWRNIRTLSVRGRGALADILSGAIHKVTDAANAFGSTQLGGGAGTIGNMVGNIMHLAQAAAKFAGVPFVSRIVASLLQHESAGGINEPPSGSLNATGPFQVTPPTFREYMVQGHGNIRNPWDNALAAFRYIRSRYTTLDNLARVTGLLTGGYKGYSGGGFVGAARPILAHVGEWVVNQAQQSKLASWLGTSRNALKGALGFSGGPDSFQGGGEVGHIGPGGVYTPPTISIDTPGFNQQAISLYQRAQTIVIRKIEDNGHRIASGLQRFLTNFNQVGGDNGLFAQAAQAIQDFVNRQSTLVQFASAGIRVANRALRFGRPQDAISAAQADLLSTEREIIIMLANHRQLVEALRGIQVQIRHFGPVTAHNTARWQQLIGARQQLIVDLNNSDQNLSQAYSDRIQKTQNVFTTTLTQRLRPSTLALGSQQAQQAIAQSFGRLGNLLGAGGIDQQIVGQTQTQVDLLQKAFRDAQARAARDPRWQTVADDIQGQLEQATTALAQAQAQALQDAITSQDTKQQMANAALQLRDTLAQALAASSSVAGPANQFAASLAQIQTSVLRQQFLGQQIGAYQGLLSQAQAQNNQGAIVTLTQTIDDLTGQLAQATLATQQLVTANRQLAVSMLSTQAQASSGFLQAATSIVQTIGQITGSLNLPQLIAYAQQAGQTLISQGQQALQNILQALRPDPTTGQTAFGANQGAATGFLTQLATAFQQGPQAFADMLSQLAPGMAGFEAGLPPDQQTLFQNLVQSLIDNTTATVQNNLQLQQLNATTNQQAFTSSAWTMFREAIFNGLGGLLPQYALTVPSMDVGGTLMSSGLLYGHKGETIIPANVSKTSVGATHIEPHLHITSPTEVADPVYLSNRVAWMVNHDPNSR